MIEPLVVDTDQNQAIPGARPAAVPGARPAAVSGARPAPGTSQGHKLVRILVLIAGLGIAAVGLFGGGAGLLISLFDSTGNSLEMATACASFLALAVGLGLAVAWQAGQAIAGRPSARFQPRRIGVWILLFVAALVFGQVVRSLDLVLPLTFPPFHIAAAVLPPLIILAAVGRSLSGFARWRGVVLETGSGALLSTPLAFCLEFAAIVGVLVSGLLFLALRPGGVELLQALANRLQDPVRLQNTVDLAPLARSPLIAAAILLFVAGIIPLVEEAVKTIGVGLLAYQRPTLPEAVVWGVASGAGFALAEAMFNSISGLQVWAGVALMRVGASLLHCLTGGLMGLGWYYLVVERRPARTLGLYAGSVTLHGLWNALVTGISLLSLIAVGGEPFVAGRGAMGLGSIALLGLLGLLAVATIPGLALLARYARRHSPTRQEPGTPAANVPATAAGGTELFAAGESGEQP